MANPFRETQDGELNRIHPTDENSYRIKFEKKLGEIDKRL